MGNYFFPLRLKFNFCLQSLAKSCRSNLINEKNQAPAWRMGKAFCMILHILSFTHLIYNGDCVDFKFAMTQVVCIAQLYSEFELRCHSLPGKFCYFLKAADNGEEAAFFHGRQAKGSPEKRQQKKKRNN